MKSRFFVSTVALLLFSVALGQVAADQTEIAVQFDSIQLDRRYSDVALTGIISYNSTLFVRGGTPKSLAWSFREPQIFFVRDPRLAFLETLDSPVYDHIYSKNGPICSNERCYQVPILTSVLDGAAYLFCQYNDFFAPARLFPVYQTAGVNGTTQYATIDDLLRRHGASIGSARPSRDSLMFAVFAPFSDQNFTELGQGMVKFSQYSAKETNASATITGALDELRKFSVNVSQCVIRVLSEDISIGSPDGEEMDFTAAVAYPKKVQCDFNILRVLKDRVYDASTKMANSTSKELLDLAYEDALSALSNPHWTICSWLVEALIHYKESAALIQNTTDCWEAPNTPEFALDPCCNRSFVLRPLQCFI